ncbi:MAG: hypothetical protein ACI94Y_000109 [Maribacter sp.]|jgi:hypothetical protein
MYKITTVFLLLTIFQLHAQVPDDYFQQQTNYTINVELDDNFHILEGTVDIEYINNAPRGLEEIYLHLWPNAYKDKASAFATQVVENGSTDFYFAKQKQMGGYREIEIKVNGKVVQWDYWKEQPDIALLVLSRVLKPGESITINTRFKMKIPDSFSRMGHVGQSYQMTQWYPKPAVYDKEGWHPMPYLDQGEFYSEFGNFDVNITLPKNYVVGATGVLQTESEIAFLQEKINSTREKELQMTSQEDLDFPVSDAEFKTIQYKAENVHDFAWFADKRFYVDKSEAVLLSGKKIDTYVMFTNKQADLWVNAIDYVNKSVIFYSEMVGEYPYPHATAVQSALSAGAGMEYPMITVIGEEGSAKSLDEVITHEVGHNWFYGILASNERDYPWMDEGFNSYYEHRYMEKEYEDKESMLGYDKVSGVPAGESDQVEFYLPMRRHTDQPVGTSSQDFRLMNYWIGAYSKPAYLLEYLEYYLGQDEYDRIMHVYYDTWKFKHPQPSDVHALFEKESGKNLSWLFDGLINTVDQLDYKVKSVKKEDGAYQLTIQNKGEIIAPFPVDVVEEKKIVKTVWVEGFEGEKTISIAVAGADKFVLDSKNMMPDFNRKNNTIKEKGGKIEPLQFKFLGGLENPTKTQVYWTPIIGYNKYDGFMAGLALYNTVLPSKKFEWMLAPMFAVKSKEVTGTGTVNYHIYPNKLQRVTLGVGYKGFANTNLTDFYNQFEGVKTHLNYRRIKSSIDLEFKKRNARSDRKQTLSAEFLAINRDAIGDIGSDIITNMDGTLDTINTYTGHEGTWNFVPRIKYSLSNQRTLMPYEINAVLEQFIWEEKGQGYAKLSVEAKTKFFYKSKKALHLRAFAGAFFYNKKGDVDSRVNGDFNLTSNGVTDYWADDYYFGRGETTGFLAQQIHMDDGGFKTVFKNSFVGTGNQGLVALNLKLDLPMKLPNFFPNIRPYLDIAYVATDDNESFKEGLFAQAGIALGILDDRIGIYFPIPILSTQNMRDGRLPGKYFTQVSFTVDLNRMNPSKFLYNFDL